MKYASYLIFAAFITTTIIFLKNALESGDVPLQIVGSHRCAECHELLKHGNQQKVWLESKHSKAYNSLLSDKAINFSKRHSMELPQNNKLCLKCHTTKHFLNNEIAESYRIEEGVGCEACHGAGSRYLPADVMKDETAFIKNNGVIGDEKTCLKCHSPAANKNELITENSCPFQEKDFVFKNEFEKNKHTLNKDNFK